MRAVHVHVHVSVKQFASAMSNLLDRRTLVSVHNQNPMCCSGREVATAHLSGFQIDFFMHMAGHDKTTSVAPCVAYLMKATHEGDGSAGNESKANKQAPAMWEARTTSDVVKFSVACLSQCSYIYVVRSHEICWNLLGCACVLCLLIDLYTAMYEDRLNRGRDHHIPCLAYPGGSPSESGCHCVCTALRRYSCHVCQFESHVFT